MLVNLILIRHGESEANVDESIYYKIPDHKIKLTDLGKEQARVAGTQLNILHRYETTRIIYSPYVRAKETAQIIQQEVKTISFKEEPLLHEISLSHSIEEMNNQKSFLSSERDDFSFYWYKEGTAESYADVYNRAKIFYQGLLLNNYDLNENDNLIIVSHGVFLLMLKAVIYKHSVEEILKERWLDNCQYTKISINCIKNQ